MIPSWALLPHNGREKVIDGDLLWREVDIEMAGAQVFVPEMHQAMPATNEVEDL